MPLLSIYNLGRILPVDCESVNGKAGSTIRLLVNFNGRAIIMTLSSINSIPLYQPHHHQPTMTDKFGRYEIKSEIGRGGMATVYHANDPRFERDVAIKVLPREFLHDPQFRARFEREAKMIALLEHPAIVPVYDFGEEEGQPFIVMRYMSGGSLSDRLEKGSFTHSEAAQIIERLAPALDAAHSRGIVHRDLKPGNILFDQYGNAFLSDFGIARLAQTGGGTLTGTAILGTPAYMSPEQVQGDKEIDGRSDIYALGVIFFQMLTGSVPYRSDTPAKVMMMHLLEPVPLLQKVNQEVPEAYQAVIQHAMAKDPDQRFSTAGEMATAIDSILRGEKTSPLTADATVPGATLISTGLSPLKTVAAEKAPALPSTAVAPPRKRIPSLVWILGSLAGFGLIAALAIVLMIVFRPKSNSPKPTATQMLIAMVDTQTLPPTPTETPTSTSAPSPPGLTPTLPPTDTPHPTDTPLPTTLPPNTPTLKSTDTPAPLPTDTPIPVPNVVVIGGSDKIAFINADNIYAVNVDGTDLIQLTTDNAEKSQLEWTPDGEKIIYISGIRIQTVDLAGRVDVVASFDNAEYLDAFEISPDSTKVAISLNRELFIVPLDWERLGKIRAKSGLMAMAQCPDQAPFINYSVKTVQWSADSTKLAVNFRGSDKNGKWIDLIDVLDVSYCGKANRLDEFPATRFTISGYESNPTIQNFAWDGVSLFSLTGFIRNGGFGNLYIYNMERRQPRTTIPGANYVDPVNGTCCYRDPRWSPDGRYLLFVFQDIGLGANSVSRLYYIPYSTIGTGATYEPLPLPETFFSNPREKPQPALRPAR
jgi:serine/threonine protein kinase